MKRGAFAIIMGIFEYLYLIIIIIIIIIIIV